jgi:hypothetical protein
MVHLLLEKKVVRFIRAAALPCLLPPKQCLQIYATVELPSFQAFSDSIRPYIVHRLEKKGKREERKKLGPARGAGLIGWAGNWALLGTSGRRGAPRRRFV